MDDGGDGVNDVEVVDEQVTTHGPAHCHGSQAFPAEIQNLADGGPLSSGVVTKASQEVTQVTRCARDKSLW